MNNTNVEVNDMGQSVIAVFPYIYFMSDILRSALDGETVFKLLKLFQHIYMVYVFIYRIIRPSW